MNWTVVTFSRRAEILLSIVQDELGKSSKISRIAQSAACVLFAARKVKVKGNM